MKKKLRCQNCGTTIKDTDMSCPICHMVPERSVEDKKEVEEKIIHSNNNTIIWKFIILFLLVIGLTLSFIGFIHMKDVTYCSESNCTRNNLFLIFIGITLTLSSIITLIRSLKK